MKKLISFFALSLATILACAQSVESLGFSPSEIRPNATTNYTIVIKDLRASVEQSDIPLPQGLNIIGTSRSQNISIISGKRHRQTQISFTIHAKAEGTYTIPEWEFKWEQETYKIPQAKLVVSKDAPAQESQQSAYADPISLFFGSDPFSMGGNSFSINIGSPHFQHQRYSQAPQTSLDELIEKDINLEIKLPRGKIYVGESLQCELVLAVDKSFIDRGIIINRLFPQTVKADAFDCAQFPQSPNVEQEGDKILYKYPILVTPLKEGKYDLDFSIVAEAIVGYRTLPIKKDMPSKSVDVLPLPSAGKPANFNGAIGNFTLEDVKVNPDAMSVGEPSTMSAKIIGVGNFSRISSLSINNGNDWKTYKFKSSFTNESGAMSNIGTKTFECTIVPNKPDLAEAPELSFSYFNPETEKYVELKSPKIEVSVAPTVRSKQIKEREENANAPVFDNEQTKSAKAINSSSFVESPIFWICQVVILALLIAFVIMRKKTIALMNNPALVKKTRELKAAVIFLKYAQADATANDSTKFFSNARKAIQNALSADTDLESEALLQRQAEDIMRQKGFSEQDIADVSVFFEGADAINYGGLDTSKLNLRDLSQTLSKIIRKIK